MTQTDTRTPLDRVRPLLRVRQYREFTNEPISDAELDAIADVARWSGSSSNEQPWRFVLLRESATLRQLADIAEPQTRPFRTAVAGVAIVLPDEPERRLSRAFDEGRTAERLLIAASFLDLGGAITWVLPKFREAIGEILGLPPDRLVRTLFALGHPSEAARRPHSAPGQARNPREQMIFRERWPSA